MAENYTTNDKIMADESIPDLIWICAFEELEHLLDSIGFPKEYRNTITAAYCSTETGEYTHVWLSESSKPYMRDARYYNLAFYGM